MFRKSFILSIVLIAALVVLIVLAVRNGGDGGRPGPGPGAAPAGKKDDVAAGPVKPVGKSGGTPVTPTTPLENVSPRPAEGGEDISGLVQAAESRLPIAGAIVHLGLDMPLGPGAERPWIATAETDAAGAFSFPGLRYAPYRLRACSPGRMDAEANVFPGSTEKATILLSLDAGTPCTVEVDTEGGLEPLPGQRVLLEIPREGWSLDAVTDAAGKVSITGIPRERLKAAVDGWEIETVVPGYAEADLSFDESGESCKISVERGVSVRGLVLDAATHAPIQGARVGADSGDVAVTEADGSYQLAGVTDTVTAFAPGYAVHTVALDDLAAAAPGSPTQADFNLERGLTIFGTLSDKAGRPVAGARIGLVGDDLDIETESERYLRDVAESLSCETNEKGGYRLQGIPAEPLGLPGSLDLQVRPPGSRSGIISEVDVGITSGELEHRIVLDLIASVPGSVSDAGGQAVAGARILVESKEDNLYQVAASDEAGRFELRYLPPGDYGVAVTVGEAPVFFRSIVLPVEFLDLRIEPGTPVRGTVVSDGDGEALAGLKVRLNFLSGELFLSKDTETDSSGNFLLDAVPPGEYSLDGYQERGLRMTYSYLAARNRTEISVAATGWSGVIKYPSMPSGWITLKFTVQGKDGSTREPQEPVEVQVARFKPLVAAKEKRLSSVVPTNRLGSGVGSFQARVREGAYDLRCVLSQSGTRLTKIEPITVNAGETVERVVIFKE